MGFRFLHLADLHLDTCFGGNAATRARLRRATLEAFEHAADLAIESQLHAVLVAGDAFDDPHLSLAVELAFARQVKRLSDAGVWFMLASGNHDPGGPGFQSSRVGIDAYERVHVFRRSVPERVVVTDRDGHPVGLVCSAGFAQPAESQNLVQAIGGRADGSLPAVGLVHTLVDGARSSAAHDRYAVCSESDFARSNFSYWALGHIHVRQQAVSGQPVYYAGNLQGRNAKETGEKGGWRVDAEPGRPAEPAFVRLGPVRWARIDYTVPRSTQLGALVEELAGAIIRERASPDEELVVAVCLEGVSELARSFRRPEELATLGRELRERTGVLEATVRADALRSPVDLARLRDTPNVLSTALDLVERGQSDDALLLEIAPEVLAHEPHGDTSRLAYLRELLAELSDELVERCMEPEGR